MIAAQFFAQRTHASDGAGCLSAAAAPASARLVPGAFGTHHYGLVNGDEIRKDPIRAGVGAEIEQSSEARSNDCGKQKYHNSCSKHQHRGDDHQGFQFD